MLYYFALLGGARQDREYYTNILRARSKGTMIADERSLFRRYDLVPLNALLAHFKITLIQRPIYWDVYSLEDDPC